MVGYIDISGSLQEHFALAGIAHLSKDVQKAAIHRPGDSFAFVAASRFSLAVAPDPNDADRRLLAPLKLNLTKPTPVLVYRITDDGIEWEPAPVPMNAKAIFNSSGPAGREDGTDAGRVIADLLTDEARWPMDATEALEVGQAHGIPERTFRRAAGRAGIEFSRVGFGTIGKSVWSRPGTAPVIAASDVATMGNRGKLA